MKVKCTPTILPWLGLKVHDTVNQHSITDLHLPTCPSLPRTLIGRVYIFRLTEKGRVKKINPTSTITLLCQPQMSAMQEDNPAIRNVLQD
jgi:hypothetical protein